MNRRLMGAVVGAGVGLALGAIYGYIFVMYRERLAAEQARREPIELPDEPTAEERANQRGKSPRYRAVMERARELRGADPDLRWADAMKMAANSHQPTEVTTDEPA